MSTVISSTLTTAPITYPLSTWMGTLISWSEPSSCSSITEAITITRGPDYFDRSSTDPWRLTSTTKSHSEYRNNITHWEIKTRNCRPGALAIQTGEYFYPAYCPVSWTSYPTVTTVIVTVTATSVTMTSAAEFTDAMCCPPAYTGYLLGSSHFCSVTYPSEPQRTPYLELKWYNVVTWMLIESVNSAGETEKSSYSTSVIDIDTLNSDAVLTAWPVFVRYPNTVATFTPTKTGEGWLGNPTISHKPADRVAIEADEVRSREKKKKNDLIVWICVPIGCIFILFFVVWVVWKWKYEEGHRARKAALAEKRRLDYEERRRQREGGGNTLKDEEKGMGQREEVHKPELMGSVYVGPQLGGTRDVHGKPELDGHITERSDARGVMRRLEEFKYDEIRVDDDTTYSELDYQSQRRRVAGSELDHQSRCHGVADAELEGRERERRAAEMDAGRLQQRGIARKQVPARGQSYVSELSSRSSPGPDSFPHSPILGGPIPDFTSMYPSPSDPDAVEEERKLERQAQRLRERREQLAREEAALQERLAQRGSGV